MVINTMVLFLEKPSLEEQILDAELFLACARDNEWYEDVQRVVTMLASLKKKAGYP